MTDRTYRAMQEASNEIARLRTERNILVDTVRTQSDVIGDLVVQRDRYARLMREGVQRTVRYGRRAQRAERRLEELSP